MAPPPLPPSARRRRRALRWAAGTLAALCLLVLALAAGAWWWAGSAQSLATTLARAARYLPAGQTLEAREVTGALRTGGHIGWLRWQSPTLAVEVHDATLGWALAPLLRRQVHLGEVHAARIDITRRGPPDTTPTEVLQQLVLPVEIDLPFRVDDLRWAGPPALAASALAGRYRYTEGHHQLVVDGADIAGGHYQARATLEGAAPMALDATLQARVATPVPGSERQVTVGAGLVVRGTLATTAARLELAAAVRQAAGDGADAAAAPPMRADATARIAPWAPQPVLVAHAALAGLDLARLWPGLPATLLAGTVDVDPQAGAAPPAASTAPPAAAPAATEPGSALASTGWRLRTALRNDLPGPWDTGRLPVERLDADAAMDPAGSWTVPQAVLRAGGGELRLDGRWGPPSAHAAAPWQARATLHDVHPGQLHTRLEGPAIGGTAQGSGAAGGTGPISFELDLSAAAGANASASASTASRRPPARRTVAASTKANPNASTNVGASLLPAGLALRSAALAGTWADDTLDLRTLRIRGADVSADGVLQVRPAARAGRGKLALVLPGGRADAEGDMAPAQGTGSLHARIDDAAGLQRWVEQLPGLANVFGGTRLDGATQLDASWNGGWEPALRRWQQGGAAAGTGASASASAAGRDLSLQATLNAQRLDITLLPDRATDRAVAAAAAPATTTATAKARTAAPAASAQRAPRSTRPGRGQPSTAAAKAPAPAPVTQATPTTAATAAAPTPPAADPTASNRRGTSIALRGLRLELSGSLAQASVSVQGTASTGTQSATLRGKATGGLEGAGIWRLNLGSLQLEARDTTLPGPWQLALEAPVELRLRQGMGKDAGKDTATIALEASAGAAALQGPAPGTVRLAWQPVTYEQSGSGATLRHRLRSQGKLLGLPMAWAQALVDGGNTTMAKLGLAGDLVFDGDWDIDAGDTLAARVGLARRSGDIRVQTGTEATPATTRLTSSGTGTGAESAAASAPTAPTTSAGVRDARITVQAESDALRAEVVWDSERAGQVRATAGTRLQHIGDGWDWAADAPLTGTLRARLPNVGVWSVLAPPGWRVQGTLEADATLAGTRAAPQWNGTLAAEGLSVRSAVDGIELRDGRLRAALHGDRLDISEFSLRGGTGASTRIAGFSGSTATARSVAAPADGGTLSASGSLAWGGGIRLDLKAEAKALRVSVRTDRQVTVSGTVQAQLGEGGKLVLRGALKTDRAVIILPDDTAPTLGSDIVVRSAARDAEAAKNAAQAATAPTRMGTAQPPDIAVTFDLGDDFAVQGRGITTRLAGQLDIRSSAGLNLPPRVTGEIRTVRGQYRAYGQQLDIESGLARFSGAYDNPALDILAIRPNITVRAGVQVTGTAQNPQVRLYSDPVLTDAETLSWVVLGRSTANGGAEAALLQQAALALLSGSKGGSGNVAKRLGLDEIGFKGPGTGADASSAALTFGKRISQKFYLTYEASLSGALGTVYIFYDLTRRLTLRGQTGAKSAVDLIYTLSYN
jgi:translocation and assembly module TamB